MAEMKTLNGYEIVDAKAREFIANSYTKEEVDKAIADSAQGEVDLSNYYTKEEVNALFNGIAQAERGSY